MSAVLFERTFGRASEHEAVANGRVNLIGEHTDYNGGYVLPTSIPQSTRVWARRRADRLVRVASANRPGSLRQFELGKEQPAKDWTDYVLGVLWVLGQEHAPEIQASGVDLLISSTVPMGSGLSSSAALEVATMKVLREAWQLAHLDEIRIAQLCQRAENEFVGARVGIMDPMAAALASEGVALFIDTASLAFERVPVPREDLELVVINSGVSHSNAHGGYNDRRRECEEACRQLGIEQLRDLSSEEIGKLDALPDHLRRRARHVITENERVLAAVRALANRDGEELGRLFKLSHASMRDDYEVSVPPIDRLVGLANAHPGVFGARLTGGGFGGSIVVATRPGRGSEVAAGVAADYERDTGLVPTVLVPEPVRS